MPHSTRKLLIDLSISCGEIIDFTAGKSLGEFLDDRMLQLTLEREFEIIGEALSRLEKIEKHTLARRIPEYRSIIGFRNIIAHGYDSIDYVALWDYAVELVPELLEKIRKYPASG